jgi:hypothetical protein
VRQRLVTEGFWATLDHKPSRHVRPRSRSNGTVTGNGSGAVTLSGTTADLNAALATLVYLGNLDYSGSDTLSITANDGGITATPDSVAITVESVAQ